MQNVPKYIPLLLCYFYIQYNDQLIQTNKMLLPWIQKKSLTAVDEKLMPTLEITKTFNMQNSTLFTIIKTMIRF